MEYFIIDAIGPFFLQKSSEVINWSKIPFNALESNYSLDGKTADKIQKDFEKFILAAKKIGYNAISIDDLAHLVPFKFYPARLNQKIFSYQHLYQRLFTFAAANGFKIFVNSDFMSFCDALEDFTWTRLEQIGYALESGLQELFEKMPINGIIFRIGETDGVDVIGDFRSKLVLSTPQKANRIIRALLPIFEKYNKLFIFRTWTVGIHPIGDLMWNTDTWRKTFKGIQSNNFIISMKYGDTDFYDYLRLSPFFRDKKFKKIVELQTRREREGFGEWPYYVGEQYEKYAQKLLKNKSVVGISVWCQTGGWGRWANRTFLENSSLWNELNTIAAVQIYKNNLTARQVLDKFCKDRAKAEFLQSATILFRKILYIHGFAEKSIYFRRLRIPPLIWIFWDQVVLNSFVIALHRFWGAAPFHFPNRQLKQVAEKGKKAKIKNIEYVMDLLTAFAYCRVMLSDGKSNAEYLKKLAEFEKKYPGDVSFNISIPAKIAKLYFALRIFTRDKSAYRRIDRFMLRSVPSFIMLSIYRLYKKKLPAFANKQAMEIDSLFK